jgi:hypothetical protein
MICSFDASHDHLLPDFCAHDCWQVTVEAALVNQFIFNSIQL